MDRRRFLALSSLPLAVGRLEARTRPDAAVVQAADARFEDIAALVTEKMRAYRVPGVGLGVFANGATTLRGFGVTSLDDPQPVTDDTLFTIASISKTVTATAVMKLVEARRLAIDGPLREYVREFRVLDEATSNEVTLWHCLTHTPGWEGQLSTEDRGIDALAHFAGTIMPTLPQIAPLGRVWSYNNAGFALAGRVIEKVTGKPIHDALRELVFAPLGLSHTVTRLTDAMTHRFTLGHRDRGNAVEVIRPFQTTSSTTAGGVLTSIADIMRYARFHLGDGRTPEGAPYLAAEQLALMKTPQFVKAGTTDQMGVGWHVRTVGGVPTLAHGGTLNGHCLLLQLVPSKGVAFAVFTNHVDGWRLVQDVEAAILKTYAGVALAPGQMIAHRGVNEAMTFHASAMATQPPIDEYIGTYQRPPVGTVEVRRQGSGLVVAAGGGQAEAPIAFYGPDVAYALSGQYVGMPYEFIRDDKAVVKWIRVNGRIARRGPL
jgi:CubicO group peptidase (beta-lactamase class C family)